MAHSPHLLDDVALQGGFQALAILRQHGRPTLCLHLERSHLRSILPHNWIVALHPAVSRELSEFNQQHIAHRGTSKDTDALFMKTVTLCAASSRTTG